MIANAVLTPEIPATAIGGGGACSGCGCSPRQRPEGGHEKIVATGWHIEFEGQVVLCETCVKFLGSLVGMIDPETQKVRVADVRRAERRDAKTRNAAVTMRTAEAALQESLSALVELAEELGL